MDKMTKMFLSDTRLYFIKELIQEVLKQEDREYKDSLILPEKENREYFVFFVQKARNKLLDYLHKYHRMLWFITRVKVSKDHDINVYIDGKQITTIEEFKYASANVRLSVNWRGFTNERT